MSRKTMDRREAIGAIGVAGAAVALGCGSSPTSPESVSTSSTASTNAACAVYSQYGSQAGQTYLRGIQTTNANGEVTFTTIYPGWYQGRATHIHLEVTIGGVSRKVTQIAFPEGVNNTVHGTGVYASRGSNPISNTADNIFADSLASELVTPTGDPASGYAAAFQVGIAL
jgi:hypothetical protein